MTADKELSSALPQTRPTGGRLFEEHLFCPLQQVATRLELFLDHRFRTRKCRTTDKLIWQDEEDNEVDYDFVMEVDGSNEKKGIPVAFFECFWRRGARHSKDKARDDSGKLMPMRDVHPTARFLGIVAGGDFTARPGRLSNRDRSTCSMPKAKIVSAFASTG
jgi:hypothetical protein